MPEGPAKEPAVKSIEKTLVSVPGAGILEFDTISVSGQRWIVPEWIDGYPTEGFSRPARMIRIDLLPQTVFLGKAMLRDPIPKAVVDGESTGQFHVELLPPHYVEFGDAGRQH